LPDMIVPRHEYTAACIEGNVHVRAETMAAIGSRAWRCMTHRRDSGGLCVQYDPGDVPHAAEHERS
jgi:hypothetical protein